MASGQGTVRENELVRILDALGFSVIRSPSSGSRTERNQPDILASKSGWAIALESKYGDPPSNLDVEEVPALQEFGDDYLAPGVVSLRYKRDKTFYLVDPWTLDRTDSGNYSVPTDVSQVAWSVRIEYDGTGADVAPTTIYDFRDRVLFDRDAGDWDDVLHNQDPLFDPYFEYDPAVQRGEP